VRLLLDTHAFLWWLTGNELLSAKAAGAIIAEGNAVFVSAATACEVATKHRLGKLPGVETFVADFEGALAGEGFSDLPISVRHGQLAGALPGQHRDPFDRMLIAQAISESMTLISNERAFDAFGVTRLW
jgi:PIN domain nuclease of toxin-antitoxin system